MPTKNADAKRPAMGIKFFKEPKNNPREVVIEGDLVLRCNTTYGNGASLVVKGNLVCASANHSISVWGDLKVLGNVDCLDIRAGGTVEVLGKTDARVIDAFTFNGAKVTAQSMRAWNVSATEAEIKSGNVGFITCERITHGPRLRFDRIENNNGVITNRGARKKSIYLKSLRL
jgi:hypothetical protein